MKHILVVDYHRDHGHETNMFRSLNLFVENLIKVRHLRRYVREIDQGPEPRQDADRIAAGTTSLPEPRPAINYILGGSSNDQYQTKRQQKKLLRVTTI